MAANPFPPPFGLPVARSQPPSTGFSSFRCEKPDEDKLPHEIYPYTFPPPTFQTFRPTTWIDMPAFPSAATTILTLPAQDGWDAVILKIAHGYNGTGFVEGSGQLIWNLFINGNQPVPNFCGMLSQIGSAAHAEDISPGFILRAGQTLVYSVTNVSLAGGGFKIFATVQGYFWRTQQGKVGST